jgi:plasmid maintenance system antidote protein VapI
MHAIVLQRAIAVANHADASAVGGDERSWLNLQSAYDLRVAEISIVAPKRSFPI